MRKILVVLFVMLGIILVNVSAITFEAFRSKHKKKYSDSEAKVRAVKFANNVKKIESLNKMAIKNKQTVRYASNKFTDMDLDEFKKGYMGLKSKVNSGGKKLAKTTKTTKTKTTKTTTTKKTKSTTTPFQNGSSFGKKSNI